MKIESKLLLRPSDFSPSFRKWKVVGVLNPGAVRMKDGRIMLYVRIMEEAMHKHEGKGFVCPLMTSKKNYRAKYEKITEEEIAKRGVWGEIYTMDGICRLPNISHFRRVVLDKNGFDVDIIEQKPVFTGIPGESDYGVEDPRITKIGKKYYMVYAGISVRQGVSTYLAESLDLKKWKRLGIIFREQNKDVVLFPEKIRGRYVAFNRPESLFDFSKPGIWISYSKDMIYWGKDKNLIRPRDDGGWETDRVGAGPPPIKTKKGWLFIYHGLVEEEEKRVYSAGAILLNLKNPEKVLARSPRKKPLLEPTEEHEKNGYVNNVVFPTGAVKTEDGKGLLVYSGGADTVVTVKKILLKDVFSHLGV